VTKGSSALQKARLLLVFAAGLILGMGLLLYGQVRLAERMRGEVDSTLFLLRAVGYATFFLQGAKVQVALTLSKLPPGTIEHSRRVAITLLVVGSLLLASVPFVRRRRRS
jgi:hypothetical protein